MGSLLSGGGELPDEDLLARLAAALWARVGRSLTVEDLSWSRHLTGDERAPRVLWEALGYAGAICGQPPVLRAEPLSRLLVQLARGDFSAPEPSVTPAPGTEAKMEPRLVWTLPEAMRGEGLANTYLQAATELIGGARTQILMVSPYIEGRGMGLLFAELIDCLSRGVRVQLITHAAGELASINSRALEELRREASRVGGSLTVFSAGASAGSADRVRHPLLHAKLVCVDETRLLLGSANLTSYGLGHNLEVGVVLGTRAARQASTVAKRLRESGLIYRAFATRNDGCE